MKHVQRLLFAILILATLLTTSCQWGRPLLYDVRVEPATITPNADGSQDVARVFYSISAPAHVDIYLEGENGERHYWREGQRRSPDQYEGWFSGVVDDRMLPDGTYRLVVQASPVDGGEPIQSTETITLENADTQVPAINNLSVSPPVFTPNRDGINDRVKITYSLAKEVDRLNIYVLGPDGERYPVPEDEIRDATAAGSHLHDYDGGVDLGAEPPADGRYSVVVEAQDAVGQRTVATETLTIQDGGVPRVEIAKHDVSYSTDHVLVGETLYFTTTVRNIGEVPIRTHGPAPGTVYTTDENYNNKDQPISDGAFRLGLDFEGSVNRNGRSYPYRWQLGSDDDLTVDAETGEKYLQPGQTVTVRGGLTITELPQREEPAFWVGLMHENVETVEDRIGNTYIRIDAPAGESPSEAEEPSGDNGAG